MKPATTIQHNTTKLMVEMPLEVLARKYEGFPQRAYEAGEERLDSTSQNWIRTRRYAFAFVHAA